MAINARVFIWYTGAPFGATRVESRAVHSVARARTTPVTYFAQNFTSTSPLPRGGWVAAAIVESSLIKSRINMFKTRAASVVYVNINTLMKLPRLRTKVLRAIAVGAANLVNMRASFALAVDYVASMGYAQRAKRSTSSYQGVAAGLAVSAAITTVERGEL